MFDVGFPEILMIGVVALIVIGPERLPEVARKVGRYVAKFQRMVRGVRSDIARELESDELKALIGDQREQINELRTMVKDTQKDLQKTTSSIVEDTQSALSDMENSIGNIEADAPAASPSTTPKNSNQ